MAKSKIIVDSEVRSNFPIFAQGDSGQIIQFSVTNDDDTVFDLTSYTVTFRLRLLNDFDEYLLQEVCTHADAANGLTQYTVQANDLFRTGSYEASIELVDGTSETIFFDYFNVSEVPGYSTPGTILNPIFSSWKDKSNSGATPNIDWKESITQKIVANINATYTFDAPISSSGLVNLKLKITQDGTGSNTIALPANVFWSDGAPPTSGTANQKIYLDLLYDAEEDEYEATHSTWR